MNIGVIYDFNIHRGGGDYVMLNILDALSSTEYEVTLLTSHPKGIYESATFFDINVPKVSINYIKVPKVFKHPYTIAYVARNALTIESGFDMYFISDDVPKCIAGKNGVCYLHYPHAARFNFHEYISNKYTTTLRGKFEWEFHKVLFPRFFLASNLPKNWLVVANSMVTSDHAAKTFNIDNKHIMLLNPPVDARRINRMWKNSGLLKESLVVCVGRFELEKRFIEVLQALTFVIKSVEIKLSLIGFSSDEHKLLEVIRDLKLEKNIELLVNADRQTVLDRLIKAKALVHPSPREPFGIAVVEGMAAGCIPIVRRGTNGPWHDIICEGKYGLSYESVEELASALTRVICNYDCFNIEEIASASLKFDKLNFKLKIIEYMKNFKNRT
jgi:glycosyltransferase involved in cell wall biosynthesis